MGIPCISTDIPSLQNFQPHINIANSTEEWAYLIKKILRDNVSQREKLRNIAQFHSPKASIKRLENLINK